MFRFSTCRYSTQHSGTGAHACSRLNRASQQYCQQKFVDVSANFLVGGASNEKNSSNGSLDSAQVKMLDEATKHIREAIMLGRTDIIKKLLEEVWCSLSDAKGTWPFLRNFRHMFSALAFSVTFNNSVDSTLA